MTARGVPRGWQVAIVVIVVGAIAALVLVLWPAAGEVVLTADDNGRAVELRQGQRLVVRLASNPTTGYSWAPVDLDASLLEAEEPLFQADSELLGAGGTESLGFRALEQGQATLTLAYHRPWEEGIAPLQTVRFTVTVR